MFKKPKKIFFKIKKKENTYRIISKTKQPYTKLSNQIARFILEVILNSIVSFCPFSSLNTRVRYIHEFAVYTSSLCFRDYTVMENRIYEKKFK